MKIVHQLLAAAIVSALVISRALAQADAPVNAPADAPANPPAAAPAPAVTAPAAAQTGITLVNIHMKQALPEDVFDDLAKQAGVKFSPNNNLWDQDSMQGGMDVDITNKPFWSALREICSLWNIVPQGNDYGPGRGGRRIQIYAAQQFGGQGAAWNKLPTSESQGFLVQATAFSRQQSINYANPEMHQDFCNIQLMVYVDPSLRLSGSNITCKPTEAVDDAGNSMMPDKSTNNMFYGGGMQSRSLIFNTGISLKFPDHPGKKIAHLKALLTCRGSDKFDTMTVDKPLVAEESTKSFGDISITFHSLKKTGDNNYEMKLSVTKDDNQNGGNDWGMLQASQLMDEKGRAYNSGGGGSGGGNNGTYDYTMNFNGNGDSVGAPVKWQIELPSKSHTIKVPVEFTDLALP